MTLMKVMIITVFKGFEEDKIKVLTPSIRHINLYISMYFNGKMV